jgi:hypothetical protein
VIVSTSIEGSDLTMGMKPMVQLKIGDRITPIRMTVPAAVKHWRYARESDDISGGIMPDADLTIVGLGTQPGHVCPPSSPRGNSRAGADLKDEPETVLARLVFGPVAAVAGAAGNRCRLK